MVWEVVKINPNTGTKTVYPIIRQYWWPSMMIFQDKQAPVISDVFTSVSLTSVQRTSKIYLGDLVTDADNQNAAIVKSVILNDGEALINARVWRDSLIVTQLQDVSSDVQTSFTLKVNSNGKVVTKTITVNLEKSTTTGINAPTINVSVYPNPIKDYVNISITEDSQAIIIDLSGKTLISLTLNAGSNRINTSALPSGVYLLKAGNKVVKLVK